MVSASYRPEDPGYKQNAGEHGYPQGPQRNVDVPELGFEHVWEQTTANDRTIAICESGFPQLTHEDLRARFPPGTDQDPKRAVLPVRSQIVQREGRDVISVTNPEFDPSKPGSHATAVAGVVAATHNNGRGIAGATQASVFAAPYNLEGRGLSTNPQEAVHAFEAAVAAYELRRKADNLSVINLSSSTLGSTEFLEKLTGAVTAAADERNVLIVTAVGNPVQIGDEIVKRTSCFAADSRTITVQVCFETLTLPSLRTLVTGPEVNVTAPGIDVLTTWYDGTQSNRTDLYRRIAGTSFATPVVSGIAALCLDVHPEQTMEQLRTRLKATTIDGVMDGVPAEHVGEGVVSAAKAIAAPPGQLTVQTTTPDHPPDQQPVDVETDQFEDGGVTLETETATWTPERVGEDPIVR